MAVGVAGRMVAVRVGARVGVGGNKVAVTVLVLAAVGCGKGFSKLRVAVGASAIGSGERAAVGASAGGAKHPLNPPILKSKRQTARLMTAL